MQVFIGGLSVKTLPGPFEMDVPYVLVSPPSQWRVATTKWQDGSAIDVKVTGHFSMIF